MNSLGVLAVRVFGSWALGVLIYAHGDVDARGGRVQEPKPWLSCQNGPFSLSCCAGFDVVLSRWRALRKSWGVSLGMLREHKRSIVAPDSKTKAAPQDMRN